MRTRRGFDVRFDVRFDDLPGGVFAAAAAASDREIGLYLAKRAGAAIHRFADLAIADGMAHADVHGLRNLASGVTTGASLNTNENDCQLLSHPPRRDLTVIGVNWLHAAVRVSD